MIHAPRRRAFVHVLRRLGALLGLLFAASVFTIVLAAMSVLVAALAGPAFIELLERLQGR